VGACMPKVAGSSPSSYSESSFRSDLLLTRKVAVLEPPLWLPVCCVTWVTHSDLSA
jgi:hypothetical protein